MSTVYDALPGIEVPVAALSRSLAEMWRDPDAHVTAGEIADDATATQVNFVLHLGLQTTPEDGAAQFAATNEFSKRYPSRVVVLCPREDDAGAKDIRAKVYGECHLGKSKSDKRCVEFAILSYPLAARRHLESQVSICLSTDLPLYYWAHAFSASHRLAEYQYLLTEAKRVLIDSARAPADAISYPWPRPEGVRDLTFARLLPIRQSLGQFLSRYAMEAICTSLRRVTVSHAGALTAEAGVLLAWLRDRVGQCGRNQATFVREPMDAWSDGAVEVSFTYADAAKTFLWQGDLASGQANFDANLSGHPTRLSAPISLLPPHAALGEAMFF